MAIVTRVLMIEVVLIALTLAIVFGHALWFRRESARRASLVAPGRERLVAVLSSGDVTGDLGVLAEMRHRDLIRLLADIAPSLVGPHKQTIVALAQRLGLTASATRSLSSRFWWRRLQGARLLTLVGGDAETLAECGRDSHPLVRAQRAEALGQHPSSAGAEELISMLDDEHRIVRFTAKESLMRLGAVAQPAITRCLEQREKAAPIDLLDVAAAIPTTDFLDVALSHSAGDSPAARARAAKLLRAIGAGSAIDRLVELLSDEDASVRTVAATAMGLLGHWHAAGKVARLIEDPDWDVRYASCVALQRLGAPGELLLRRARDGHAGPGAEVARQVLDVAARLRVAPAP